MPQSGMSDPAFQIIPVRADADLDATVRLFRAYAASLPIDLAYQDFEGELAAMPGKYVPPSGELLLASTPLGAPLGCAALRPLDAAGRCEMKRLFVAPEGRGLGLGRALVAELIAAAIRIGYTEMMLDTLASMTAAQSLYRSCGFEEITPYYTSPIPGTIFMRRRLRDADPVQNDANYCSPP